MGKSEFSAIAHHEQETRHQIHWKTRIIAKECNTTARKIREALIIRRVNAKEKRTMNQDKGIELSRLWLNP